MVVMELEIIGGQLDVESEMVTGMEIRKGGGPRILNGDIKNTQGLIGR